MRTTFTTSIAILLGLQSMAQPTIPAGSALPYSGYTHPWTYASSFIDLPTTGANSIWDLSGAVGSSTPTVVWGPITHNQSFFPEASLYRVGEGQQWWSVADDSVNYHGRQILMSIETYDDPKLVFRLPLAVGDSWSDLFDGGATGYASVSGEFAAEVTGYGTLILPDGTYEDVLRVDIVDSTLRVPFGSGPTILVMDSLARFYKAGIPWHVAEVMKRTTFTGTTSQVSNNYLTYMAPDLNVGQQEVRTKSGPIKLFPNPTTDHLLLDGVSPNENYSYALVDVSGRTIKTAAFIRAEEDGSRARVDLGGISPGHYTLLLNNAAGMVVAHSFIVE
ncbi:MAG TPA: T9SS type A sorting domain-containing protein [Flavobacteriales bacterium]|nr:T9SS type A sorting domain-containing protein [Flavobacteriales bacterium]